MLSVQIPQSLADQVAQLAIQIERPPAWIVTQALTAWVASEEARDQLTREGMHDTDTGHLHDHDAISAWIDRLGTTPAVAAVLPEK